jgi:hypothetical protein
MRRCRSCSPSSTSFPPGWVPSAYLAVSSNISGWIASRDKVLAYDFAYHVGGYLGRAGTRADVLVQKGCMQDLRAASKGSTSRRRVPSAAVLQGAIELMNPGNPWAVFRGYPAVVVEHCGNATNKKWVGRLGAADVLGFDMRE